MELKDNFTTSVSLSLMYENPFNGIESMTVQKSLDVMVIAVESIQWN